MTFVLVSKPTLVTCTLSRVGLGLSLALCYAALFTKTNRISRIFNRGLKAMVKRPSYTSPRSQLAICFCLVGVQAIGAAAWIAMDLPHATYAYPDRRSVVLRCKTTNVAIVASLMYNMVLIALCTVYAFKTRNIPENFNEAKSGTIQSWTWVHFCRPNPIQSMDGSNPCPTLLRLQNQVAKSAVKSQAINQSIDQSINQSINEAKYIAFTMYSTCIVWLAFVPIYFSTDGKDFKVSRQTANSQSFKSQRRERCAF